MPSPAPSPSPPPSIASLLKEDEAVVTPDLVRQLLNFAVEFHKSGHTFDDATALVCVTFDRLFPAILTLFRIARSTATATSECSVKLSNLRRRGLGLTVHAGVRAFAPSLLSKQSAHQATPRRAKMYYPERRTRCNLHTEAGPKEPSAPNPSRAFCCCAVRRSLPTRIFFLLSFAVHFSFMLLAHQYIFFLTCCLFYLFLSFVRSLEHFFHCVTLRTALNFFFDSEPINGVSSR